MIPPSRPGARCPLPALAALIAGGVLAACGSGTAYDRVINPAPTLVVTTVATTGSPAPTPAASTSAPPPAGSDVPVSTEQPASTASPTTTPGTLLLGPDGLGAVPFGTGTDSALATLSADLGAPLDDSGWVEARTSPYGVCPGRQVRGVRFGPLQVIFGDLDGNSTQFFTYLYAASLLPAGQEAGAAAGLVSAQGLGLGTPVAELVQMYPEAVVSSDIYGPTFSTSAEGGLVGTLSAEAGDGVVTSIIGGSFCGD